MATLSNILAKIESCFRTNRTENINRRTNTTSDNVEGSAREHERKKEFTIESPPNGGTRAWLIVVSCSAINVLVGVLETMVGFALLESKEDTGEDQDSLIEIYRVYLSLSSVFAPIAAISMATVGYELTIHVGSWFMAVSFLILSFIKNIHGIKFLLYVMAGLGSSLVQLGVLIPVLEYFSTKRMRALMFTKISIYCGRFVSVVIYLIAATSWQTLYRICMGLSIPVGLVGLTIPSLKEKKTRTSGKTSFLDKTRRLVQLNILKNAYIWLVCFLFFVYQFGTEPPNGQLTDTEMTKRLDSETTVEKILYSLAPVTGLILGAFFGWLFKFSAKKKFFGCMKQIPTATEMFTVILVVMIGAPKVTAVLCFVAPEAVKFPYFLIFSIMFFAQLAFIVIQFIIAFIEELRDDMIPDVFGRTNVKFVEGIVQMCVGIAGIVATESAASLHWKDSFRMGGGMLLVTAVVAVCILILQSGACAKIVKINPLITTDIDESHSSVDSSSTVGGSQTSDTCVTPSSGTEERRQGYTQNHEMNRSTTENSKFQCSISHGPANIRYVLPRKNRMYGNLENISDDESYTSDNLGNGRTVYTDLQASRSPDSYGIRQTNEHLPYGFSSEPGDIIRTSQYIIYSYNITQNNIGV